MHQNGKNERNVPAVSLLKLKLPLVVALVVSTLAVLLHASLRAAHLFMKRPTNTFSQFRSELLLNKPCKVLINALDVRFIPRSVPELHAIKMLSCCILITERLSNYVAVIL
jgi:hypothetical protein